MVLLSSKVDRSPIDAQSDLEEHLPGELGDTLRSIQDAMAELRAELRAYATVSKAEWSVLADRLAKLEASNDFTSDQGPGRRYRQSKVPSGIGVLVALAIQQAQGSLFKPADRLRKSYADNAWRASVPACAKADLRLTIGCPCP